MINRFRKLAILGLVSFTFLGVSSVGANAEWKQNSDGQLYYLLNDGNILKDKWFYDKNTQKSYHLNDKGIKDIGWKQINGVWYYFNNNGELLINTVTPDGYKIGNDGAWIQNNIVDNSITNNGGINTNMINSNNNYGTINYNIDNSTNTTNIVIKDSSNDYYTKQEDSDFDEKLKEYDDKKTNEKLSALKKEKDLWEKDNSAFAKGNNNKLQKSIDEIEFDKKYEKMNSDEKRDALVTQNQEKISKLKSELEQWKKDNSIESKSSQKDIQKEIKDLEDYNDIIS